MDLIRPHSHSILFSTAKKWTMCPYNMIEQLQTLGHQGSKASFSGQNRKCLNILTKVVSRIKES